MDLHILLFWPCGPSFPCLLAFWAFISLHFSFLGLHFLSFWRFGPSFPCTLAFWAFISLHFGFLGLDFLTFWLFGGHLVGPPPISCQKLPVCPIPRRKSLTAPGLAPFCNFGPGRPSFPGILVLWTCISCHFLAFWALLGLDVTFGACNFDGTASGQTQAIARARTHSFFDAAMGHGPPNLEKMRFFRRGLLGLHSLSLFGPATSTKPPAGRPKPLPDL